MVLSLWVLDVPGSQVAEGPGFSFDLSCPQSLPASESLSSAEWSFLSASSLPWSFHSQRVESEVGAAEDYPGWGMTAGLWGCKPQVSHQLSSHCGA